MRRFLRNEDGTTAVLATLCMTLFIGCLGFVVDAGQLFVQRTQLQKAVDAAALAAAYDLIPGTTNSADSDATTYVGYNQVQPGELVSASTGKVMVHDGPCAANGCPAYKVTAQRTVPSAFAGLVGFMSGTVKTSATAINSPAASIQSQYLMPFAVWDGNGGALTNGQTVTYRDNSWASVNVSPDPGNCGGKDQPACNPNWNVNGNGPDNSFKGYLHVPSDQCNSGTSVTYSQGDSVDPSKGGNSTDTKCEGVLNALAASGSAAIMPVIDYGCKNNGCDGGPIGNCANGTICVHIKGFVGVIPNTVSNNGQAWTGTVTNWTTFQGTPGAGSTSEPAVYVLKLWY